MKKRKKGKGGNSVKSLLNDDGPFAYFRRKEAGQEDRMMPSPKLIPTGEKEGKKRKKSSSRTFISSLSLESFADNCPNSGAIVSRNPPNRVVGKRGIQQSSLLDL